MVRVLLIGPRFTDQDRTLMDQLSGWVGQAGHAAVPAPEAPPDRLVEALRTAVQSCDAAIAVLEGSPLDPSAAWLACLVHANRRPVLGLRSDERTDLPAPLRASLADLVSVKSWRDPQVPEAIARFLDGVRVFAGALVRDAVPKMLREQGREMKFRQVADAEYPHVLKRKLVETAERLEDAEFGLEQEEIADLLELLETLINVRKYDKESLRSIKEGKWRKRGGFQKGYLLEEEPVLSSR